MRYWKTLVGLLIISGCQYAHAQPFWRDPGFITSGGTFTGQIKSPLSADCTAPSYSFTGDLNTGFTSTAADTLVGCVAGLAKWTINPTAGQGISVAAGTATTDVAALSVTRTNNNAAVATGVKVTFTDTTSAAGFLPFQVLGGAAGTTNLISVSKAGQGLFGDGLAFGGVTNSFPSLRNNSGTLEAKLADNSAYASFVALQLQSRTNFFIGTGGAVAMSGTAPTIASGGCTSPAVTWSNGTAAFLLTVGTSCTGVKTITLTLPATTNFWSCSAQNNTSSAKQDANVVVSRATSTTAIVLTNYARTTGLQSDYTASDTVLVSCMGG